MKKFSAQFKKQSESIRMRASERSALRSRIVSYMEYHPLPQTMVSKKTVVLAKQESLSSEPFTSFVFNKLYIRSFAGAFAVFFIVCVPVLAERAVPGDVLYPVKVEFNEELRSTLSFTPYAKVAWETERLERRISEARLLASEGKLTDEAEAQVAEAVKVHSDAAQREIAVIRESDSDEAAIAEIAFASALAVQSEVLEGHIEKDTQSEEGQDGRSVVALVQVVAKARSSAEALQSNGAQLSYEKLLGRVESESTNIYELFTSVKKGASSDELIDVERRLKDIERKVAQAVAIKEGIPLENDSEVASLALTMAKPIATTLPTEETSTIAVIGTTTGASSTVAEVVSVPEENTTEVFNTQTESELEAQAELEAILILRSALTDIQKLLNYLTHLDVRENVSIEDLVPVTPTNKEKVAHVLESVNQVQLLNAQIEMRDISSRLQAKATYGQKEVNKKLQEVTKALEKGNVDSAGASVKEAHNIASDLVRLTANEPLKEIVPVLEVQSTSTVETVLPVL